MKKDFAELPSDVQAQIRALEDLPEDEIDTTDAPEILDWSDAKRGVFYRPVKKQITIRLDADIIAWFKAHARDGRGYQTDINGALREHFERTTSSAGISDGTRGATEETPTPQKRGAVAQLGERRSCTAEVRGSNPLRSTLSDLPRTETNRSLSLQRYESPRIHRPIVGGNVLIML